MKRRLIGSLAGLALAAGAMVAAAPAGAGGAGGPVDPGMTFDDPTQNPQSFIVPRDICQVTIAAIGAEGGDGGAGILNGILGAPGANGGEANSTVTVAPGDVLQVNVGGEGGDASLINLNGGSAGLNAGGAGGDGLVVAGGGGGGGGSSDVRTGTFTAAERAVVGAGGGGGGAGLLNVFLGGAGGFGGQTGQNGANVLLGGQGGQSGGNGGFGGESGLILGGNAGGNGDAAGVAGGGGDGIVVVPGLVEVIFGGGGGGGGLTGAGGGGSGSAVGVSGGGGGGGNGLGTVFVDDVDAGNGGDGRVTITPVEGQCDGGGVPQCTDPPPLFFQPDATRESPRLGNDIYDDGSGDFQTQVEFVNPRFGSTLDIYIQNDGNQPDQFTLRGFPGAPPFLVRYQQLKAADGSLPKNYITEQVISPNGFTTGTLQPCGEMKVRIQVKVSVNAQLGQEANLPLEVTSSDGETSDTNRLIVRVVAP